MRRNVKQPGLGIGRGKEHLNLGLGVRIDIVMQIREVLVKEGIIVRKGRVLGNRWLVLLERLEL